RISAQLAAGRRRPLLPPYLVERILLPGSLRGDRDGVRFTLRNLTRPAVLTRVQDVRLDGRQLDGIRVLVQTETGRLPLPRRLDLPVGREMELLVELPGAPEAGAHELE